MQVCSVLSLADRSERARVIVLTAGQVAMAASGNSMDWSSIHWQSELLAPDELRDDGNARQPWSSGAVMQRLVDIASSSTYDEESMFMISTANPALAGSLIGPISGGAAAVGSCHSEHFPACVSPLQSGSGPQSTLRRL